MHTLQFVPSALREWNKLDPNIRLQLIKVLRSRLATPRIPKAALAGMKDCYKIKLRTVGYRLVYQVIDETVVVLVLAVGKRDGAEVYDLAKTRI